MPGLAQRVDRFWCRAALRPATVVLAAGVLAASGGCEQTGEAGTPTAQLADRSAGTGDAAHVDAAAKRTPPTVKAPPKAPLRIVFDPPELDFGIIPPNVDKTGTIAVRNVGTEAVTIAQVKPTCKCTTLSDLAGAVIPPGGAVTLTTELEGRVVPGPRKAAVRFIFDGHQGFLSVDIRAEVALAVRASPAIFNLASGASSGHVVVESMDGQPFTILAANRQPPRYLDFDPDIDEPRNSYMLEWDLAQELAENKLPHWWVIETDHPECPILDSWVRHRSTIGVPPRGRRWRVADRRILLGVTPPGGFEEFTVEVEQIGTDAIHAVRSLSPEFDAELLSFERTGADARANGVCTVRITPAADHRGVYLGAVEFAASQYVHPIDIVGKVAP